MHGARREQKWGELYNALRDEEFSLCAVAETHLRNLEEPPIQPDWHWTGQNRSGQSHKGGGVGVLWRHDLHWQRLDGECRDHMLDFGHSCHKGKIISRRKKIKRYLPHHSIDAVVEDFETCAEMHEATTYDEYMLALRRVVERHMVPDRQSTRALESPW
ncbi:hypothetical protein MRX96_036663 [Rhipicephalus microplus]